ncbi:MAG: MotA/TolQ/ExbB proton channel family protein [Synergistaceae bacterium]|jgi:biopolymer transport protein ExbB|nr:MotA/TolQ/ExbB proton channel family protein [Synergistaceae bacterium]
MTTFLEYMDAGGWVMWVILALSVASAAFVIERVIFFAVSRTDADALERAFVQSLESGNIGEAKAATFGRGSLNRLYQSAYGCWDLEDKDMKVMLEGEARGEIFKWESNLSFLEITAKISPLLGLLGTVLGMVEMFHTLNIGESVNSAAVTGGIRKALFTTAAGLTVAIPAIMAHGLLLRCVARAEETLTRGIDFIMKKRFERKAASCSK